MKQHTEIEGYSKSRRRRADYPNAQRYLLEQVGKISSDKYQEQNDERKKENLKKMGRGKYIKEGRNDRLNSPKYNGDSHLYADDPMSYHYGFYESGNIVVEAKIDGLMKQEDYERIKKIGYQDYLKGVKEDQIRRLANYASYMEGYRLAETLFANKSLESQEKTQVKGIKQNFDKLVTENTDLINVMREEKTNSQLLNLLGRKVFLTEHFEGIPAIDQDFPVFEGINNPTETYSFKVGYERGKFLVEKGFTRTDYEKFIDEYETRLACSKKRSR